MQRLIVKLEFLVQSVLRYPFTQPCPHCRSLEHTLVARKYGVGRIVRCAACGLCFSRPIYHSWLSGNFYDRLYLEQSTTRLPDEAELQRLVTTDFRGTDKDAAMRLEKIRGHLQSPDPSLLEIGSSWGYFLHQARAAGFDVTGVEVATRRREFARQQLGLSMVGDLDELPPGRRYDVIYAAHVLEHFVDLDGIFSRLAALLSDDGVSFIEVPNFDPQQFGPGCGRIVGAVHPIGFDSEFFRTNLPRHGLEVTGLFGGWDDVPGRPASVSSGPVIIVRATRSRVISLQSERLRPLAIGARASAAYDDRPTRS